MHASTYARTLNSGRTYGLGRQNIGFTAIELMVVVTILAILAALAGPSFTSTFQRWRVRDAAETLTSNLYFARSEAIKRAGGITVVASGGWDSGWNIVHTQNGVSTDIRVVAAPTKVSIAQSNGKTTLYVDRWGMLTETSDGVVSTTSFVLYPEGKSQTDSAAIRLCAYAGGRVAQIQQGAACPS